VDHWIGRSDAVRIEGGAFQLHADEAMVSKQLVPALDRELARGRLFALSQEQITASESFALPPEFAQGGENQSSSNTIADFQDDYVYWTNENYAAEENSSRSTGRIQRMKIVSKNPVKLEYEQSIELPYDDPLWEATLTGSYHFGRGQAASGDGTRFFAGAFASPGIAVYEMEGERVQYRNTIFVDEVSSRAPKSRINDLQIGIMANGEDVLFVGLRNDDDVAAATEQIWALTTDDDWTTYNAILVGEDDGSTNFGTELRCDTLGGTTVCATSTTKSDLFIFRSTDFWRTEAGVKTYTFLDHGNGFVAQPSRDGMLVAAADHREDRVRIYKYDPVADSYAHLQDLYAPPELDRAGNHFGKGMIWNGPTSRLFVMDINNASVSDPGRFHVFGRHGDKFEWLSVYEDPQVDGLVTPGAFFTQDTFMYSNKLANAGAGELLALTYAEAP
jgi:hypothetical protein